MTKNSLKKIFKCVRNVIFLLLMLVAMVIAAIPSVQQRAVFVNTYPEIEK